MKHSKIDILTIKIHIKTPIKMEMITQLDKVYNEVENWASVHHPNIIKLYEIIDDDKHDYLYVILELANMGQIAKWNPDNEQYERN